MRFPASDGLASALLRAGIGVRPLDWRLPPIETYPAMVAFAGTYPGKLALFAAFALLMRPLHGMWLELTIAAALVSLAGRYRMHVALACAAALLVHNPYWYGSRGLETLAIRQAGIAGTMDPDHLRAATLIAGVPLAAAALYLARRFRDHPLGRRPVLAQHLVCFALLWLTASHLLHGLTHVVLRSVTVTFTAYFWYLAYALIDQRHRRPQPILHHFATFHPFFAPDTPVPMGKGAANWAGAAAGTAEDLAVTQLKGLKLLAWAFCLQLVLWQYRHVIYGDLGLTPIEVAFEKFMQAGHATVSLGLLSIVTNFPEQLLVMAIWGHVIVATARLAGFRLLRNTYRPLSSRTIAEFWNRYFYYFKELLAYVYFYPTYLRCFKRHPRLRIAFATFIAAGLGNFIFHFLLAYHSNAEIGLFDLLIRSQTYAFYCVLLAAGIILSQLRGRRPHAGAGWLRGRFVPSLGVAAFYCFLSFFDSSRRYPLTEHFAFLLQAFGIG